ncbi:MAG TPA: YetF domain-containing protein [Sphingomonas sp.]|nr:YetF domain-containing protein [Sphingomonas sp.]
METLQAIFGQQHNLSFGQECARAVLIFAFGLVLVRLAGRRVFGKWAALDIVVSIIVGSSLSRALTGSAPLMGTLAASVIFVALHGLLANAAARWQGVARVLEGRSIDLAHDGRIDQAMRKRHSVSLTDFDEALRRSGIADMSKVKQVTLEPSGRITVIEKQG